MKQTIWMFPAICLLVVACGITTASAEDPTDDKALVEKAVASYVTAFNSQDAKALANHWSPEAVYTNPLTGESVTGRDAIEKEFAAIFKESKEMKLAVEVASIQFISPSVALEGGVAKVISGKGDPKLAKYSAVHVKKDGRWMLDRVREEEEPVILSHYDKLKDLEWMIGTWVDADGNGQVETTCQWTRNKNFITRSFTVSIGSRIDVAGMQVIGWDPAKKQIRSWIFDSDGGFAEGVWKKTGKSWSIQSRTTLPDGRTATATSIFRPLDEDSFGWQKVNRIVDGEIHPNIDEIVIVRKSE